MRDGSSLFSAKHNGGSSRNRLPIFPKVVFHWPPARVVIELKWVHNTTLLIQEETWFIGIYQGLCFMKLMYLHITKFEFTCSVVQISMLGYVTQVWLLYFKHRFCCFVLFLEWTWVLHLDEVRGLKIHLIHFNEVCIIIYLTLYCIQICRPVYVFRLSYSLFDVQFQLALQ
jgi:hypothetical protein